MILLRHSQVIPFLKPPQWLPIGVFLSNPSVSFYLQFTSIFTSFSVNTIHVPIPPYPPLSSQDLLNEKSNHGTLQLKAFRWGSINPIKNSM